MRARAPASTANIGPGFDCLGAALSLFLEIETGEPGEMARIVRRAVRCGADADVPFDGTITSAIPRTRGLGSSAACVAAGLLIGARLGERSIDKAELLRLGTPIEGHPDNLAAALYGGITLALPDGSVMHFEPSGGVRPLVLVPDVKLSTAEARRALPDDVPRADAIANIARSSGLLAMLTGSATPTARDLLECTDDRIHQPYRAPLMPQTSELVAGLRARGIAAAVSGAGPSVICLVVRGDEQPVRDAARDLEGWELLEVDWDLEGAHIVVET